MIISASYKTDIPAFYGEWFANRLQAGYCTCVNPHSRRAYRVDLSPSAVDGFVFWTKNIGPFLSHLEAVEERGNPFIIQYTITDYPRSLEYSVVDGERAVGHFRYIANTYGHRVAVWRYDTIIFSSITPYDFHVRNFERLARALEGSTDEVIVSFAQMYKKTRRNLSWASRRFNFTWEDPPDEVKLDLATKLAQIAKSCEMQLSMCGQRQYLTPDIDDAKCIDASRLSDVADRPILAEKKGHRSECGCYASADIGEYDTCPHGCVYCYAVQNRNLAQRNHKRHDPESEFLLEPEEEMSTERSQREEPKPVQERLF
jgi:hypothetical protein